MGALSVGAKAIVEVVCNYLYLVVDGGPGPVGPLQGVRIYLRDCGVRRVLDMAEEDALQDRVRRLVVEFRTSERQITIDLVLLSLCCMVVSQEDGSVDSWVASEGLVRDGDGCGIGVSRRSMGPSVSSRTMW